MSVVAPLAIVAILACWAVPDSMGSMDLLAEATVVREGEGAFGTAGQCVVIMILGHGEPLEAVVASVFYSGG